MTNKLIGALMLAAAGTLLTGGWIRDRRCTICLAEALASALERMAGRIRWQNMPLPRVLSEECNDDICGMYFLSVCEMLESDLPLHVVWKKAFSLIGSQKVRDILCRVDLRGDAGQVIGALHLAAEELRSNAKTLAMQQQDSERLFVTVCGSVTAILIIILI